MTIPFTQYHLPHGRTTEEEAPCSNEIQELADLFIERGGRFECEILQTGHVSLTAVFLVDKEEQDIAIEVGPNNEWVKAAVERLVRKAVERSSC